MLVQGLNALAKVPFAVLFSIINGLFALHVLL